MDGDIRSVIEQAAAWRGAGATHLSVNTTGAGLASVDDHLAVLARVAAELGVAADSI